MSPGYRRKPGRMGPLFIVTLAVTGLALVTGIAASVWFNSYLRSEAFRSLLEAHAGGALGGTAALRPLRWQGAGVYSEGASVRGAEGSALESIEATQLRATIDWRAVFGGKWRVDAIEMLDLNARLVPPAGSASPPRPAEKSGPLPSRVEIGHIRATRAGLTWSDHVRIEGSQLDVKSVGAGWELAATGGRLKIQGLPDIVLDEAMARWAGGTLFLTRAAGQFEQGGKITGSGEFGAESMLRTEWSGLDLAGLLSKEWRNKLSGILAGEARIDWPAGGPSRAEGRFALSEGRLKDMALLEQIAKFTGSPQFRRMPLQEVSGQFVRTGDGWTISDFVIESKGLMRATGGFRISAGEAIEGTFEVGVTPQVLQWIPGSRERVFTRNADGYVWTTMRLGGTLSDPREDLSGRLALAATNQLIDQGTRVLENPADAVREGARGVLDALAPLLR